MLPMFINFPWDLERRRPLAPHQRWDNFDGAGTRHVNTGVQQHRECRVLHQKYCKKNKEKAELSIANLKNHHTLKVSKVSDVGLPMYNGALKYVKTIQKLEFKILMCILMPIYGKSIAPWVPAYPLLTGMIRQKPMAQLDVFVRGIPIFGTNPEMVWWLPIVSITYRPTCNWWYISFWIVKPYRSIYQVSMISVRPFWYHIKP